MTKKGPIIIIDDDEEDQLLCKTALENLIHPDQIRTFTNGSDAFKYLLDTKENPYLILCDLQMPKMDGLELRVQINNNDKLRKKTIPFIFISGSAHKEDLTEAYELGVHGFFTKPNSLDGWTHRIEKILQYWNECLEPGDLIL